MFILRKVHTTLAGESRKGLPAPAVSPLSTPVARWRVEAIVWHREPNLPGTSVGLWNLFTTRWASRFAAGIGPTCAIAELLICVSDIDCIVCFDGTASIPASGVELLDSLFIPANSVWTIDERKACMTPESLAHVTSVASLYCLPGMINKTKSERGFL
jgi:hypothetical protein